MIISVASGKGGTGKTTIATNLALASCAKNKVQFVDCDVEEPNAHIFLKPQIEHTEAVVIPVPEVNLEQCSYCGKCAEICAFNALAVFKEQLLVFPELCHGCGGCSYFCPQKAITESPREIGAIEEGLAQEIPFKHGRLNPGEAMSPPLIKALKQKGSSAENLILDAPPGTSCPAVTTVKGSDFCLLVTEPTPFGLHDLELAVGMVKKLALPCAVLVNRADIGTKCIDEYCAQNDIPVLMHIPWDKKLAQLYAQGEAAVLHDQYWDKLFAQLWGEIKKAVSVAKNNKLEKEVERR